MTTRKIHAAEDAAANAAIKLANESNAPAASKSWRETIPPDSFLRQSQVSKVTSLGKSTLYSLMARGLFPRPIHLSERCVAWPASSVFEWMDQRIAASSADKVA